MDISDNSVENRPADTGEGGALFTLADARKNDACEDGYDRFRAALRKAYPDATDLDTIQWSIGDVARVNLDDAMWCLRMVQDARTRVAAIMPAVKRAAKHTTDGRVHGSISEIDRWLAGDDTVDLEAAAAEAAARAAAEAAARAAARVAAEAAAGAAAAARAAAEAAAGAAAAARAAAEAAAWAAWAARATAEAAARAAARAAAEAAAWTARAAAEAAARADERDNQRADLIATFPPTFEGDAS